MPFDADAWPCIRLVVPYFACHLAGEMARLKDIIEFYDILGRFKKRIGGKRTLLSSSGHMEWPQRGVYFFMETGEGRSDTGDGSRVVRVGTHGLTAGSKATFVGVDGRSIRGMRNPVVAIIEARSFDYPFEPVI
jgi:hypothetical protein